MDEKIKSLTDAVNNTTESEKSKKIDTINTALKALVLDGKFSVPKKDNPTEQESKTFDGNTNNDEIASIIESLIKDEPDQAKKNQYKSDLTAALQGARDALKTLASESHQIRQAIENETTQTSDKLNVLSQILTEDAKTTLELYTNKTNRSEMTSDVSYTKYIHGWQIIIVTLGASTHLSDTKDNDIDSNTLGPRTRAGIKTIQTHLNSIGVSREDLGCKNNLPDGIPGPKTLQALLKKEGDKTILQKMIEDKKNNSLNLTIIEPEFQKVSSQKDTKHKTTVTSTQSSADSSGLGNQSVSVKSILQQSNVHDGNNINNEIKLENNTAKWIKSINYLPKDKNGDFKRDKKLNISYLYKKDGIRYRFFDTGRVAIFNEKTKQSDKQNSKNIFNILESNVSDTPIEKTGAKEGVPDILFRGLKRQENEIKQKVENSLKEHGLGQWKVTGFKQNNGVIDVSIASTYNLNQHVTIAKLGKKDIETKTDHINNDNIADIIIRGIEKHDNKIKTDNKKLQEKVQKEIVNKEKLKKLQNEIEPKIKGKKYTISDIYGIGNEKVTNYKYQEFFNTFSNNTLEIDRDSVWVIDQNTVSFGFNQKRFDKDFVKNLTCNTQDIISNGKFDENKFKNILGKIIDKLIGDHYSS